MYFRDIYKRYRPVCGGINHPTVEFEMATMYPFQIRSDINLYSGTVKRQRSK